MTSQEGVQNTTGGLTPEAPNPDPTPPTPVPNPLATSAPADPPGDSSDEKNEEGDGVKPITLTQKELDEILRKRLEQQKRQLESQAQREEQRRQAEKDEQERKAQEEKDQKESELLAQQNQFKELAEKSQGQVRNLTTERDGLKNRVKELETKVEAGNGALQRYVDAELDGVPDHIKPLLDRMELPERLEYLVNNRDRLKPAPPAQSAPPVARQAAPVPSTPKPDDRTSGLSEAEQAQAKAATTEHYRRGIF